ncbi:YMGG-like glycine zipper-containing protein [Methylocaldum sp. MU1018]
MKSPILFVLLSAAWLSGCAGMSSSQQRMLSGTAGSTAAGAAIGAIAGNAGLGAAIGAGAGLVGSYLYDQHKQAEDRAYRQGYQQGRQQPPPAAP